MAPVNRLRKAMFGDRPELSEDERRLVLRAMAVIAVPLAAFTALILLGGGAFAVAELRDRTQDNKDAIARITDLTKQNEDLTVGLNIERANRENALAWQVYDQCIAGENLDANFVDVLGRALALSKVSPPSPQRTQWEEAIQEAIDAREPEGEVDCIVPLRARPGSSGGANAP